MARFATLLIGTLATASVSVGAYAAEIKCLPLNPQTREACVSNISDDTTPAASASGQKNYVLILKNTCSVPIHVRIFYNNSMDGKGSYPHMVSANDTLEVNCIDHPTHTDKQCGGFKGFEPIPGPTSGRCPVPTKL